MSRDCRLLVNGVPVASGRRVASSAAPRGAARAGDRRRGRLQLPHGPQMVEEARSLLRQPAERDVTSRGTRARAAIGLNLRHTSDHLEAIRRCADGHGEQLLARGIALGTSDRSGRGRRRKRRRCICSTTTSARPAAIAAGSCMPITSLPVWLRAGSGTRHREPDLRLRRVSASRSIGRVNRSSTSCVVSPIASARSKMSTSRRVEASSSQPTRCAW